MWGGGVCVCVGVCVCECVVFGEGCTLCVFVQVFVCGGGGGVCVCVGVSVWCLAFHSTLCVFIVR